jgi:hypothetical protein
MMAATRQLWKTTLVIWSDTDPSQWSNAHLGRESEEGEAWCETRTTALVTDPEEFPATDFFNSDD